MKTIKEIALYFHDWMSDDEETAEEVKLIEREMLNEDIKFESGIGETDMPPFKERNYDILFFDWGGAMIGNNMMGHFCQNILEEALECPSKVYVMVSSFTRTAMREAQRDFQQANGELPPNVFLDFKSAAKFLNEVW